MIVVIGPKGRLGSRLARSGAVAIECDITDVKDVRKSIPSNANVVINAAAFTRVDDCEKDSVYQNTAIPVNCFGVNNILTVCQERKIWLIHISTDYVFGGKFGPYSERWEIPDEGDLPVNSYGLSKLGGESFLLDVPMTTIVRTTGLYGSDQPDFLHTAVNSLSQGKKFSATNSLIGNQTYIPHLSESLMTMAGRIDELSQSMPNLIHLASRDVISRYQFACMIASIWGFDAGLVMPVNSRLIQGWTAKRPTNGGLLIGKADSLGLPIYSITEGLHHAHENWDSYSAV